MKYYRYMIETTAENEDTVAAVLYGRDISSIEIDDGEVFADAFTGEIYPELQPDVVSDKGARVSFYEEEALSDSVINDLAGELSDVLGEDITIEETVVDDADWKDKWKEYFHGFTVDDIHISPTWEDCDDHNAGITIRIDPGMAFGTGKHESTYMILEHLREYLSSGASVLDVGCGSGILSIAAAKLGAKRLRGTDIDSDSVACTYENLRLNGIDADVADVQFLVGDIGSDDQLVDSLGRLSFDIVFANILADIIIGMADSLYELSAEGGLLLASGIIDFKEEEVIEKLTGCGFTVVARYAMGEWRSVVFRH